jgi:hypothetical protein
MAQELDLTQQDPILSVLFKALSVAKIVTVPVKGENMSVQNWCNHRDRGTRRTLCKTCPDITLPARSPTCVGLGLKSGLHGERPPSK